MKIKKISGKWYFLIFIILIYLFLLFFKLSSFISASLFFLNILEKIIPVLIAVFVLMSLINYFFTPKIISKYFMKKGIKKWFFVIIGGILSTGAIYVWYPLLAELKDKGLSYGLIACFLYNRAIKIPMLPLIVFYFSLKYVLILCFILILMSVVQGVIVDKFIN
ncbi:hypothetical protein ES703_11412 [subsurface metagenome]